MNPFIAIFQIGPVQLYISKAKKTQDFWSGSYILSYLAAVAIETVNLKLDESIIYPYCQDDPLIEVVKGKPDKPREHDFSKIKTVQNYIGALPNRFVAVDKDREALSKVLKEADQNVNAAYLEIVRNVSEWFGSELTALAMKPPDNIWKSIWQRQNTNLFSTMWVIYECQNNTSGKFGTHYKLAERLFGARKGIRNFEQLEEGEPGEKCSLCGEREALDKAIWQTINKPELAKPTRMLKKLRYAFRENERLCTACTVKRLAPDMFFDAKYGHDSTHSDTLLAFPSTSMIAVSPALRRLAAKWNDLEVQKQISDFNQNFKVLNLKKFPTKLRPLPLIEKSLSQNIRSNEELFGLDGDAFIEDTYQKKILEKEYGFFSKSSSDDIKKINICKNALKKLMDKFKPPKYFAVIMMDGDDMGKHLSDCVEEKDYRDFSKRLNSFAKEIVPRIAESYFTAKVAYFGGDEGVIFVGIDDLLPLMRSVRAAFSGHIRLQKSDPHVDFSKEGSEKIIDDVNGKQYDTAGKGQTACIGAVVAHHQQSLHQVMQTLHRCLEKKAKKEENKDAFCIGLMKRSGGTTYTTGKWFWPENDSETDKGVDVMAHLEKMVRLYKNDDLSKGWLFDLDIEKHALGTGEGVHAEVERLIRRHSPLDQNKFRKRIEPVYHEIHTIYKNMINQMTVKPLDNLIQLEFAANYIAKGGGN